jgi:hypothetical protein
MANENLSTFSAPAYEKVRPRETTSVGPKISKRATHIKIGGKVPYTYGTEAVMMPARGQDEVKSSHLIPNSHARALSGKDTRISETSKKASWGNTWQDGSI